MAEETSLVQCLDDFVKGTALEDYKCNGCGKAGGVTKSTRVQQLARYAVIKLTRTDIAGKIETQLPVPTGVLDLAPWFVSSDTDKGRRYEVTGVIEHFGKS